MAKKKSKHLIHFGEMGGRMVADVLDVCTFIGDTNPKLAEKLWARSQKAKKILDKRPENFQFAYRFEVPTKSDTADTEVTWPLPKKEGITRRALNWVKKSWKMKSKN